MSTIGKWFLSLEERQQNRSRFAVKYAEDFHHGTDGHHRLMLIAKLAQLLDEQESQIVQLQDQLREISLRSLR